MNRKMDKNLTVHRHYTYEINQKMSNHTYNKRIENKTR